MRNYRGSDFNSGYPLCELSLEDFKHIVTPKLLAQLIQPEAPVNGRVPTIFGFRGITFNGNLGDFASARDALEIVQYIAKHNVPVHINTNGSLRSAEWWCKLALPDVTVGFALDGLADTHRLYRQDTDWHRIIEHAQALIRAGGQAVWRFVPFDHNRHQEQSCRQMAHDLGFVGFENIYDGRDNGPVYTRTGKFSHTIGPTQPGEAAPIEALIENHVTWYDAKTFRSHKDVQNLSMDCLHKKNQEILRSREFSSQIPLHHGEIFVPIQLLRELQLKALDLVLGTDTSGVQILVARSRSIQLGNQTFLERSQC